MSDQADFGRNVASQGASIPSRRRRMDKYSDSVSKETAPKKENETVNSIPPVADAPLPIFDELADKQPVERSFSAPAYDNSNVGEQRRLSLQRPPQSTDVHTRITQTGYHQTVRQQARPFIRGAQQVEATPGAQFIPPAKPESVPLDVEPQPRAAAMRRTTERPERDEEYERRMASRRSAVSDEADEEEAPQRHILRNCLIGAAALIAVLTAVYFFLPAGDTGFIGSLNKVKASVGGMFGKVAGLISPTPEPAQLLSFNTAAQNGTTASQYLFQLTTTPNATDVKLVDESGEKINSIFTRTNDESETNRLWEITVMFAKPYTGAVYAALEQNGEWITTDKSLYMTIVEPAPPAPTPALTPAPTDEPQPNAVLPVIAMATDTPPTDKPVLAATDEPLDVQGQGGDAPALVLSSNGEEPSGEPMDELEPSFAPTLEPVIEPTAAPTEKPTAEPTIEPTAAPTEEPTPSPVPTPEPAPTPSPMPALTATNEKSSLKITDTVFRGAKAQTDYLREGSLAAVNPDNYMYWQGGVLTFRGDSFRRNASFGTVEIANDALSILWKSEIGSLKTSSGSVYGVGWTGQPAIVKWSKEVRELMNINETKKDIPALREVIFSAQDGKVYFLDLTDGQPTRDPISIGYPLKGSVSVDTMGRPIIGFGQGVSKMANGKTGAIGYHLYNLIDGSKLHFINGRASNTQKQYGSNGAFDGTSLFLWNSDSMIVAGENGLLYTVKLNTDFDLSKKTLTINPEIVYLRSKAGPAKNTQTSIESSVAMYNQYVYMVDNYGALRCVDTDTMSTVWALDTGDNTDASPALDFDENGQLWLYTGNTNTARLGKKKDVSIRRINALTGEIDWTYEITCKQDKADEQSGAKASPIIGENSIDNLVIFTVNQLSEGGSRTIAFDKSTGSIAWTYDLTAEAISSPVAVYNEAGDAWIIQGDLDGELHLLDGRSGAKLSSLKLNGSIQGSPAVYRDILVVGTSDKDGSYMYGIKIE